tara:strand:+ start:7605 stop:10241 length:2637 start_codon:yes stop_codon:yes gene_type:complete
LENQTGIKLEDEITENYKSVEALKEISLELLQNLSGEIWSDYNIHDPGITTLEILCYVITELGYRSETNIEDIFQSNQVNQDSLFEAHEILSSGVFSIFDLKKMILDIDQVRNVDIIPSKNYKEYSSLYSIWIDTMTTNLGKIEQENLRKNLSLSLSSKRFLGTDFDEINFLKHDLVSLDLEIEISNKVAPKKIFKNLIGVLDYYFSPTPNFQSVDSLLDKKISSDYIFSGPNLKNGVLLNESLQKNDIKKQLYISDLINQIMNVEDIKDIKKINLVDQNGDDYSWVYKVKGDCVARLDLSKTKIKVLYKNNELYSFKDDYSSASFLLSKTKVAHKKNTLSIKKGNSVDLKSYKSIQYDFPSVYGVGELGAPIGWSQEKTAYAKQFKSFLSFFDQVLANFFAQLNHLPKLFSLDDISTTNAVQWLEDIPKPFLIFKPFLESYLLKNEDIKDEKKLEKEWNNWIKTNKNNLTQFLQNTLENQEIFYQRRNKILEHLLARFGYDFSTFDNLSSLPPQELINHKLNLLKDLPRLGTNKYYGPLKTEDLNSNLNKHKGFKNYLMTILGFRGFNSPITANVNKIMSPDESKGQEKLSLGFKERNLSEGINQLFKYGSTPENYVLNKVTISLLTELEEEVCLIKTSNKNRSKDLISKLSEKIGIIDKQSENLYLFDHISLRPMPELMVFGFTIKQNEENIFYSPLNLTKEQQKENEQYFLDNYSNKDQYQIIEVGHHQFKIIFDCKYGSLTSNKFFENNKEANTTLEDYLSFFSQTKSVASLIEYATKYNYIYNEISDPFSNITTVVLPKWPSRFQSKPFKNHINNTIIEEAPSNVFMNIKWLDYQDLVILENAHSDFVSCSMKDLVLKEEKLEYFLLLLMNNE